MREACAAIAAETNLKISTEQEHIDLGLLGLLPLHIEVLREQIERAYEALPQNTADIEKYIYLRGL